jgi:Dolichyl-phosphate-mannose-protein mannosyltransferase
MAAASPPLSRQAVWDIALSAWRSSRLFAFILLTLAVILGAFYRFHRLARWDMNGDEGVAWVAAAKPALRQVAAAFWRFENGGKLPLFDIVLHEWVRIFGDSLFAMRAMSAALGTIAIVLVFAAVREICRCLGGEAAAEAGEVGGAFAALIYALNLTMLVSDRTAREFPLLATAELAQIIFFVRAQRRATWTDYLGVAIFTALMIPINYTASFLLAAEALWLGGLLLARWAGSARAAEVAVFSPGFAVMAGIALLAPLLPGVFVSSRAAVQHNAVSWIQLQPASWPFTVLRDVAGKPALFHILVALMVFAVWWQWRSGRLAWGFLAAWMLGPVLAVYLVTYLIQPMEFPRYVLIAFIGMFAFAGFGAGCVRSTTVRIVIAILIVHLSAPLIHGWFKVLRDGAWREATALADQSAAGGQIAVCSAINLNVVRFYLPPERRRDAVAMQRQCGPAPVMILSGRGVISDREIALAEACYPRVLARLQLVEVRAR